MTTCWLVRSHSQHISPVLTLLFQIPTVYSSLHQLTLLELSRSFRSSFRGSLSPLLLYLSFILWPLFSIAQVPGRSRCALRKHYSLRYLQTRYSQRLEAILRSSLYSHFSESLSGIATIRAYNEEGRFLKENRDRMDYENRAYWMTVTNQVCRFPSLT